MRILDNLFGSHVNDLQFALSRSTQRQGMLMNNLANVDVPGFKRKDIDFHVALANEIGGRQRMEEADRQAQEKSDQISLRVDGNNVDLEKEVMSVTETEMHYQAVSDLVVGYFQGLKNVIKEGK